MHRSRRERCSWPGFRAGRQVRGEGSPSPPQTVASHRIHQTSAGPSAPLWFPTRRAACFMSRSPPVPIKAELTTMKAMPLAAHPSCELVSGFSQTASASPTMFVTHSFARPTRDIANPSIPTVRDFGCLLTGAKRRLAAEHDAEMPRAKWPQGDRKVLTTTRVFRLRHPSRHTPPSGVNRSPDSRPGGVNPPEHSGAGQPSERPEIPLGVHPLSDVISMSC